MALVKVSRERLFSFLKAIAPYVLLFLVSLAPLYIFFASNGMTYGDDSYWHRLELTDLAYGFEHGFAGLSTGHNFLSFMGVDIYGFYGPFPHYFAVAIYEMFKWAGASLTGSLKFTIVLLFFLSNVAVYLLATNVTGSRNIGLVMAFVYNFLPYKMYCVLYRAAYTEAVALCFIPLVFYGLYRILNDREWKVSPFIVLGVSAACLVLSHPITALVTASACAIYLLLNCYKLPRLVKNWKWDVSFGVTVLCVVGLVSPYVFTAIGNEKSDLYNISIPSLMWTSFDSLKSAIGRYSNRLSGFLYWPWLEGLKVPDSEGAWWTAVSIAVYVISCVVAMFLDLYFKTLKHQEKWRYLADAAIVFVPAACFQVRVEVWLALAAFYCCFLFIDLRQEKTFLNDIKREKPLDLLKQPDIYFLLLGMAWLSVLLYLPDAWKIVPQAFYNIQFPYRLWGLFGFFAVFFLIYVIYLLRDKPICLKSMAIVAGLLFTLCHGPIDKRLATTYLNQGFWNDASVEDVQKATGIGWQNEYLPQEYSRDSDYKSDYSNSLYYKVRDYLFPSFGSATPLPTGIDGYFAPVYLEGSGEAKITYLNSPSAVFDVTVTSESALIQIPQFYYDGYRVTLKRTDTGATTYAEIVNVDGLVSYRASQGTYVVNVDFVGPKSYRVGRVAFYLSIVGLCALGAYGVYDGRKMKKKQKPLPLEEASGD